MSCLKKYPSKRVSVFDFALSDQEGQDDFYLFINEPAYSGLKQRQFDENQGYIIQKIQVQRKKLDEIIDPNIKIDLIKIDVEGGELPVMKGARRIIESQKPYIIFESGKGASELFGTSEKSIYVFLVEYCGMCINTLDGFLLGRSELNSAEFANIYDNLDRYYFIAHKPLNAEQRLAFFQNYILCLDSKIYELDLLRSKVEIMEGYLQGLKDELRPVNIIDWGDRQTFVGAPVNLQPDGSSAMWIKAENLNLLDIKDIFFGSVPCEMRPTVCEDFFTIDIPNVVINTVGSYEVTIHEGIGRKTSVGIFNVVG